MWFNQSKKGTPVPILGTLVSLCSVLMLSLFGQSVSVPGVRAAALPGVLHNLYDLSQPTASVGEGANVGSNSVKTFSPGPVPGTLPGKLVYDTSARQIFVLNPDGSGLTRVGSGWSPLFSPDGKRLAFLNVLNHNPPFGTVALSTSTLSGSDKQNLCTTDANAVFNLVRWSPHGRFIVLNAGQFYPGYDYLCNTKTHTLSPGLQTSQGPLYGTVYDWSPDGTEAVWQASSGPAGSNPDLNLYYGDPTKAGADAVKLTTSARRSSIAYTSARFSPDGKTIAVAGSAIFFLSVPGQTSPLAGKVLKGFSHPYSLAWSPDGRTLAVTDCVSQSDSDCLGRYNKTLDLVAVASGKITRVAANVGVADWSRQ